MLVFLLIVYYIMKRIIRTRKFATYEMIRQINSQRDLNNYGNQKYMECYSILYNLMNPFVTNCINIPLVLTNIDNDHFRKL